MRICSPSTASKAGCGRRENILAGISTGTHRAFGALRNTIMTSLDPAEVIRSLGARVPRGDGVRAAQDRCMTVSAHSAAAEAEAAQIVLNTIRRPVIMIGPEGTITFANADAEDFFRSSAAALSRKTLAHFMPFGSPILALVDQVRARRAPVNEYRVDVSSPRIGIEKIVDLYVAPVSEFPGSVVVMFQERSMADKIDRQMTHRSAARSVTGLAAMLAHEIKNPLSGIRGAAQLLETAVSDEDRALTRLITDETDRIVSLVDRMEIFSDERPINRYPVNIHVVLDHVKAIAKNGFASQIKIIEDYDPSLPSVYANRDQLIQVFLNLVKNAAEAVGNESRWRDHAVDRVPAGHPRVLSGHAGPRFAAARILRA